VNSNTAHHPNESADYRRARQALLAEEIELRRHIERVAEMRRALPPGGEVTKKYEFEGEDGKIVGRHRSTGIGHPRFWERARYYGEEKRLAAALAAAEAPAPVN